MEIETIIKRYNPWWFEKYEIQSIHRLEYIKKLNDNFKNEQIIFITGLRREEKQQL